MTYVHTTNTSEAEDCLHCVRVNHEDSSMALQQFFCLCFRPWLMLNYSTRQRPTFIALFAAFIVDVKVPFTHTLSHISENWTPSCHLWCKEGVARQRICQYGAQIQKTREVSGLLHGCFSAKKHVYRQLQDAATRKSLCLQVYGSRELRGPCSYI